MSSQSKVDSSHLGYYVPESGEWQSQNENPHVINMDTNPDGWVKQR